MMCSQELSMRLDAAQRSAQQKAALMTKYHRKGWHHAQWLERTTMVGTLKILALFKTFWMQPS